MLVIFLVGFIAWLSSRMRDKKQKKLIKHGFKICGQVRHVKYEWAFRRSMSRYYELYAEFEYDGKTYYALKKCHFKPKYQKGDPIGICFDPDDPNENMILDFSDSSVNP